MTARLLAALACSVCLPALADAAQLRLALPADEDLAQTLEGASLTAQAIRDEESTRRDIVAATQADYRRLLAVLWDAGYFGPTISIRVDGTEAADLPVVGSSAPIGVVDIAVQTGPRYQFGRATIGPVAPGTELPEGFAPGQPAGTDILREATSAGIDGWRARGHAKADLADQDITARHEADRIDVALTLAPGPRLTYGPLIVEGDEAVREGQIRRIADLRQGDVYDPDQVEDAATRLQRTGAFRSVSVTEAERIGPGNTLPMTVTVVERLPRRFGFGAEVATDEGLGVNAFWLHRNLTGYADSLRIEGEIDGIGGTTGGEDYSLGLTYNRPATFNPETDLYVAATIESLDQLDYQIERAGIEVGARRIVSEEFEYSYGVGFEQSRVTDDFGTRNFSILYLPAEATYDRRDDPLNPADGYYVGLEAQPFAGLGDGGSGLRYAADLRGYQGFGEARRTVLAARVLLGGVAGPDIEDVPADYLFYSGGGGTVRGQEYESLGVELPSGREVGGKSFAGLSAEVRQGVTENIGIVGFVDAGYISPEADYTDGESHVGAGLGLRYNTGIGPIRVDLGVPVSQPDRIDAGGVEIYIGIGQAF